MAFLPLHVSLGLRTCTSDQLLPSPGLLAAQFYEYAAVRGYGDRVVHVYGHDHALRRASQRQRPIPRGHASPTCLSPGDIEHKHNDPRKWARRPLQRNRYRCSSHTLITGRQPATSSNLKLRREFSHNRQGRPFIAPKGPPRSQRSIENPKKLHKVTSLTILLRNDQSIIRHTPQIDKIHRNQRCHQK